MALSSASFTVAAVPAGVLQSVFITGPDTLHLVRDVRMHRQFGTAAGVLALYLKRGSVTAGVLVSSATPQNGMATIVDGFIVLEAGDELLAYSEGAPASIVITGHAWFL